MSKPSAASSIRRYLDDVAPTLATASYNNKVEWLRRLKTWMADHPNGRTDQWADYLKSRHAPSSVKVGVAQVSHYFRWLERRGIISSDRIRPVRLHAPATSDRTVITEEEYQKLRAVATGGLRSAILMAWHTGLRYGDVMSAKKSWLINDSRGPRIEMVPHKIKRYGRKVCIPLPTDAFQELVELPDNEEGRLFPKLHEWAVRGNWGARKIRRLFDLCGLKDKSWHCFRHAFITRMLEKGVQPAYISLMTGQTVAMIMQYQRVSPDALRRLVLGEG